MEAIELISQDLFDKVRSRYSNLEMGDETGNVTNDPRQARFFDFDFVLENENLGRISISINERGALKVFYSQGILEDTDPATQQLWFSFLREMRMFAKRRLLRFDTRDITKSNLDKTDFQYLAQTGTKEETMAESKMFGSTKSSYLPLEKTRLIIRHNKPVDEDQRGARSRNINALYIENADGERFKYPFIHLSGAKAMQRHVANGGRPYDDHGKAIIGMSEQIAQLNAFKRHVGRHDSMQTEANEIMERAVAKLETLRQQIENIGKQGYYESWKETVSSNSSDDLVLDQATMETYKNTFTVNTFKEDLAQYFPLIHRIMQEAGEVDLSSYVGEAASNECDQCHEDPCVCSTKETTEGFAAFEDWAESVIEGRPGMDQLGELGELLKQGLTLGVDGVSAIEAIQGIGIQDEDLSNTLENLAKIDPEADPSPTILTWLNKIDPEMAKEFGHTASANSAPAAGETPAEEDMVQDAEVKNPSLNDIAEMVKSFYDKETNKFPLGETGVITKVRKELGDWAGDLAERLVHALKENSPKANDEETDEGILGTLGGAGIGMALGGPIGAAIGAVGGQEMTKGGSGIIEQDDEETDEGWKGQLAGGTVGTLAGTAIGAIGGPIGALVGGAVGGTAGQMIGDFAGGDDETTAEGHPVDPDDDIERDAEGHPVDHDEIKRMLHRYRAEHDDEYDSRDGYDKNDPKHPDWLDRFESKDKQGMAEGKADYNFDAEDLKRLERIRDLPTLKTQALALISQPSAKPMKPEKVEWFKNALDRMNSPVKVIKLMYDLLLSGEGHAVVGSRSSMNPSSYRQRFVKQGAAEAKSSVSSENSAFEDILRLAGLKK